MNNPANFITLIVLGLIWSSFAVFTKICAETLSPFFISFSRLFIASIILYSFCFFKDKKVFAKENLRFYLIVGFFNSALPFTLFAYSAKILDSSIISILDGTVPIFEMLISIYYLKKGATKGEVFGILIGMAGVVITYFGKSLVFKINLEHISSIVMILCATLSFAIASVYIDRNCKHVDSLSLASGSVTFSTIMLLPFICFIEIGDITTRSGLSMLGLGVISTAISYVLYFKLLTEESPRVSVSVALIIPVFGIFHSSFFLSESITMIKIIGCLAIILSIKFILKVPIMRNLAKMLA